MSYALRGSVVLRDSRSKQRLVDVREWLRTLGTDILIYAARGSRAAVIGAEHGTGTGCAAGPGIILSLRFAPRGQREKSGD